MFRPITILITAVVICLVFAVHPVCGQTGLTEAEIDSIYAEFPEFARDAAKKVGLVWHGYRRHISFEELAAYCAPILWFSPDEPLLHGVSGPDIHLPVAFPFEEPSTAPVVYYRLRRILAHPDVGDQSAFADNDREWRSSMLDLLYTTAIDLDYFFYYPSEEGLAAHPHDIETVQMKVIVIMPRAYPELGYWIVVQRIIGKAHGVIWYDNILETDKYTNLPIHILVEEGKHASCTDQNGDGEYSPGYDVNRQVNDAWGVRDNMRGGYMFTGGFHAWMAKQRPKAYRVFPPLPADSSLREKHSKNGVYAPDNAVYEVRPFPRSEAVGPEDPHLEHFIASKGSEDWPEVVKNTSISKFGSWVSEDSFFKSISVSYRYDAHSGIAFAFPLLIVKNVGDPIGGGWFFNRVYLKDHRLRDVAWNLMYAPSASRWIDSYFGVGVEWDSDGTDTKTEFMVETGVKLRFSIAHSPMKFMSAVTDFWGLRIGVKNFGLSDWSYLGWIFELGAGNF